MCAQCSFVLGYGGFLIFVLFLVFPGVSVGQIGIVESDPSVVRVLPSRYPLNRVKVDARQYPWSAVGRITLYDSILRPGGLSSCTGTLVGEQLVLTAAHCVWSRRQYPEEVFFLAGFHQSSYVAHSKAKNIHVHETFESGEPSLSKFSVDWALIELEKPIGKQAGYVGLADFDAKVFEGMDKEQVRFKLSGYRGDRLFVQTVDHDCRIDGFTGDKKLMLHSCPLTLGDSGGPVFLPVQGELLLVGIDVGLIGVGDMSLKRGEQRLGVAVPSSSFLDKLIELGVDIDTMEGSSDFAGRLGWDPRTLKDSLDN